MALGSARSANMSSGLLLDPMASSSSDSANGGPRFRPYASTDHQVTKARYITSNDPRGYIPVFEYPLNGQWIMLDMDDGYILWTGIWKALGNSKADIVKMVDSQPDLAPQLRRVRGGYLKIQGTWMPYEIALRLSRCVAWPIRYDLVPLFGPNFPSTCLSPDQPGYGQLVKPGTGKRRARRTPQVTTPVEARPEWPHLSPVPLPSGTDRSAQAMIQARRISSRSAAPDSHLRQQSDSPIILHEPYSESYRLAMSTPDSSYNASSYRMSPRDTGHGVRYSPYPSPPSSALSTSLTSNSSAYHVQYSPQLCPPLHASRPGGIMSMERIRLPAIQTPPRNHSRQNNFALPPISTMDKPHNRQYDDSSAVLRRLQRDDDPDTPDHLSHDHSTQWHRSKPELVPNEQPHISSPGARRLSMQSSASMPSLCFPDSAYDSSIDGRSPVSPALPTPSSAHPWQRDVHLPHGYPSLPSLKDGLALSAHSHLSSSEYRGGHRATSRESFFEDNTRIEIRNPTEHAWRPW